MHKLILASQSPNRRDLLKHSGFNFHVDPVKVSEIIDKNLKPRVVVESLARAKVQAYIQKRKPLKKASFLVLTADTIVVIGDRIFGKPKDLTEAKSYLFQLSGKTHKVITALCVYDVDMGRDIVALDETKVCFRQLLEQEISDYVASGEPIGKAGGYAIQGLGNKFVVRLEGSFSNVVGLPMELFNKMIKENGWQIGSK